MDAGRQHFVNTSRIHERYKSETSAHHINMSLYQFSLVQLQQLTTCLCVNILCLRFLLNTRGSKQQGCPRASLCVCL